MFASPSLFHSYFKTIFHLFNYFWLKKKKTYSSSFMFHFKSEPSFLSLLTAQRKSSYYPWGKI